ncbi:nuclear transport factor 2 family protein [Streptomyces sp. NPDC101455]|uniref:nuclear transport factor 2 family protein n=1 Tax=Streptomyces sp. NPDC101455 TaxID=3366142 RepID=UPI0037FF1E10
MPPIAEDAVYWLSGGSRQDLGEIAGAIKRTCEAIQEEKYEIGDLEWVVLPADHAMCRYHSFWTGVVDGQPRSVEGRGTNVILKCDGARRTQRRALEFLTSKPAIPR